MDVDVDAATSRGCAAEVEAHMTSKVGGDDADGDTLRSTKSTRAARIPPGGARGTREAHPLAVRDRIMMPRVCREPVRTARRSSSSGPDESPKTDCTLPPR